MESFLIDFNSPKLKKEDVPLIPESLLAPMLAIKSYHYPISEEESNPFDLVGCQAAANFAAENDPFEMVLNDAINSQGTIKEDSLSRSSCHLQDSPEIRRKSMSLPDLRQISQEEVLSNNYQNNDSSSPSNQSHLPDKAMNNCAKTPKNINHETMTYCGNSDSVDWNYLDDIPPPDSLLNSTVDMSCFLDDTLPTAQYNKPSLSMKQTARDEPGQGISNNTLGLDNPKVKELPQATYKSDEELRMLAHKKIENIITRAKLEVRNDIQDSIIQRRLSTQEPSFPNLDALALCTPKRTSDFFKKPEKNMSQSLKEWSQNELMKLNLIFPESTPYQTVTQATHLRPKINVGDIGLLNGEANISLVEMPIADTSFTTALPEVTAEKSRSSRSPVIESEKRSVAVSSPPPSSPTLLPLPLCEDAVRNLSLCSKYSPPPAGLQKKDQFSGESEVVNETVNLEKNGKQAKLLLRKLVLPSKTNTKMAPMKATAPVQVMTRTRSSVAPSTKPDSNNLSNCAFKTVSSSRESCSRSTGTENPRPILRMPPSPSRSMSGSLPNLSSHGGKLPSRLPSPRRPSATSHDLKSLNNRPQIAKGKSVHHISSSSSAFHSSPRPVHKGSLSNRSGGHTRVLTDVNSCASDRSSPKCRTTRNQSDTPRRGRSLLTEKENFL